MITDATCDIPAGLLEKMDIDVIPMEFQIDGKSYLHYPDAREMDFHEFYERMRNGQMPTTSQINMVTYNRCFEPALIAGKDVLYICFSSKLSGTYQASLLAAKDLQEKYPNNKIICVDSRAASIGEGLLVFAAYQKKRGGMPLEELAKWVDKNSYHVCHSFMVDDLNHLRRGGRISAVSAIAGCALGIKPLLHVDNEGYLVATAKVRGRKKAIEQMVSRMERNCVSPKEQTIIVAHGDCPEDAEYVKELLKERLHVKDVFTGYVGPIIGTHTGPGMLAFVYFGTEK
jgi:DegV family protein with EDD domain